MTHGDSPLIPLRPAIRADIHERFLRVVARAFAQPVVEFTPERAPYDGRNKGKSRGNQRTTPDDS